MSLRFRILLVTLYLSLTGAFAGALCGMLALIPLFVNRFLRPGFDHEYATFFDLAPYAAAVGAIIGVICGPLVSWLLLRDVPLWRVILWAAAGTVLGSFAGSALVFAFWLAWPAIIVGAVSGLIIAGAVLRARTRRISKGTIHVAAT